MDEIIGVHPALLPLFNAESPNHPILFAALDGMVRSTILVDQKETPNRAAVRTPDGLTFFSSSTDEDFIKSSLRRLQDQGPVMAIIAGNSEKFPKPDVIIPRLEFLSRDPNFRLKGPQSADLPSGYHVRAMDPQLITGCEWRDLIEATFGTLSAFFDRGFGYCLMDEEKVVTEAYAAFSGAGSIEIGVNTAKPFRGLGYGEITAGILIHEIEHLGEKPYWSCDQSNPGSVSLARKLGFKDERVYEIFGYRPLKVPEINER